MQTEEKSLPELPSGLSEAIERVMANPELMSAVAAALGKVPPAEASAPPAAVPSSAVAPPTSEADLSRMLSAAAPLLSAFKNTPKKSPENDRSRLLQALKPYVNPTRQDAIDTMLRITQITEILRQLN